MKDLEFGKIIGRGSFAVVYRGCWQGKDVALKQIRMPCGNINMWQLRVENEHYSGMQLLRKTRVKFNTRLLALKAHCRRSKSHIIQYLTVQILTTKTYNFRRHIAAVGRARSGDGLGAKTWLTSAVLSLLLTLPRTMVSIFAQKKRQRHDNFLAGSARSAHRLPLSLEQSIVADGTASSATGSSQQLPSCKRGCPQTLSTLKHAFDAVGLHPAKVQQKRIASYPVPKKQKLAHRNIRGIMHGSHYNFLEFLVTFINKNSIQCHYNTKTAYNIILEPDNCYS